VSGTEPGAGQRMKCRTKPSPRLKPSVRAKGKSKTERIIN